MGIFFNLLVLNTVDEVSINIREYSDIRKTEYLYFCEAKQIGSVKYEVNQKYAEDYYK